MTVLVLGIVVFTVFYWALTDPDEGTAPLPGGFLITTLWSRQTSIRKTRTSR